MLNTAPETTRSNREATRALAGGLSNLAHHYSVMLTSAQPIMGRLSPAGSAAPAGTPTSIPLRSDSMSHLTQGVIQ